MNFFADLPNQAKALIGGLLVLLVVALGANFIPRGGKAPSGGEAVAANGEAPGGQALIYTNMEPKNAAEAAAELKDKQIPFEIVRDGTAIAVPKDRADEARIKLALKGLPKDAEIGFSQLFGDKPNSFISTDFEKQVAFKRALNGELSRLIKKIDGIDGASVIVNMPEEQLFAEEKKPTTASVMVKQAPNRSLNKQQVEGIQNLVAASVPGLKTTNVTVVSETGRLLSDGMSEIAGNMAEREVARALSQQMMLTHERENEIETKVQSLLDKMYGPGRSVVRVAVDLDFTQKKERTRLFAPPTDKTGATAPTYSERSDERSGANGLTGGVPGTSSNTPGVPTYPTMEGMPGSNSSAARSSERQRTDVMSTNETIMEAPVGTVKRISVTALIQGLTSERIPAITQIVASTAGADVPGRGDQIVVQPVNFDTSQTDMLKQLIDQETAAAQAKDPNNPANKKKEGGVSPALIIGVGAAFLMLIVLLAIIRMANRREDTTDVLVNSLGDPGLPPQFDPNALAGFDGSMQSSVPMAGNMMNDGPFGFLEQMDPETVADLLMQERPATAAGILGLLDPGYGDMVLSVMSPDVQEDLINRLQTQPALPAFQQKTLAQQLKRRLGVPA